MGKRMIYMENKIGKNQTAIALGPCLAALVSTPTHVCWSKWR